MSKIFKNLLPFWKSVIIILALLLVQAWCDLSLPQYTSDIIDVGIQNSGVEHVLPEAVTKEEFETAKTFMTEDEITEWENAYEEDGDHFVRTENDGDTLDDLDGDLSMALVMNYQMSMMDEATFKETIAAQMQMDPENLKDLSVEQIGQMLGADLTTFTREKEDDDGNKTEVTCVDVRPLFQNMLNAGMMQKSDLLSVRDEMEESFNAVGDTMIQSIGVAYAIQCDKDAGIDVDHIQTSYLWAEGLRMIGLALLMGVATVLVGLFASKVAAGVGAKKYSNGLSDSPMRRWIIFPLHPSSREVPMMCSRSRWLRYCYSVWSFTHRSLESAVSSRFTRPAPVWDG